MTLRPALCLLLLACCPAAWADAPKAVVRPVEPVQAGDICLIDAGESTGDVFRWEMLSQKRLIPSEDGRRAYFSAGQPGKYRFLFVVAGVVDGKAAIETQRVVVEVLPAQPGPAPAPPAPDPAPVDPPAPPAPAPAPLANGWHVTLVRDPLAPLPSLQALAQLAESPTVFDAVKALGGNWHRVDVGSAEFNRRNLADVMARDEPDTIGPPVSAPCLIVQDASGKVVRKSSVDVTRADGMEDSTLAFLKTVAGGR